MADDTRQQAITGMGQELGGLYLALSDDLVWVFIRWLQFKKLFRTGPTRLDILNRSAPFFFWVVQQTLWEDTILAITRLAAPEKTMNKANLTVRRIPHLLPAPLADVDNSIAAIDERLGFATVWRNRRLAHRDLAQALGHAPELPDAQVDEIDALLDLLADVLNAVQFKYTGSTTGYRFTSLIHDADELLFVLRDGLRLSEQRLKRIEDGDYRAEDWHDGDLSV